MRRPIGHTPTIRHFQICSPAPAPRPLSPLCPRLPTMLLTPDYSPDLSSKNVSSSRPTFGRPTLQQRSASYLTLAPSSTSSIPALHNDYPHPSRNSLSLVLPPPLMARPSLLGQSTPSYLHTSPSTLMKKRSPSILPQLRPLTSFLASPGIDPTTLLLTTSRTLCFSNTQSPS